MKRWLFPILTLAVVVLAVVLLSVKMDPEEAVEKERKDLVSSLDVLDTHKMNNGQMVYSVGKVNDNQDNMYFADYVKRSITGYKWVNGGGHVSTEVDPKEETVLSLQVLSDPQFEQPVVFGVLLDENVSAVSAETAGGPNEADVYGTNDASERFYAILMENGLNDPAQLQLILTNQDGSLRTLRLTDPEEQSWLEEGGQIYINNSDLK